MAINTNLYNVGFIVAYKEEDFSLERNFLTYTQTDQDIFYTVIESDKLDTIAFKFFGNSKLWWYIAMANDVEDTLVDPFRDLRVGMRLLIPNLENFKNFLREAKQTA